MSILTNTNFPIFRNSKILSDITGTESVVGSNDNLNPNEKVATRSNKFSGIEKSPHLNNLYFNESGLSGRKNDAFPLLLTPSKGVLPSANMIVDGLNLTDQSGTISVPINKSIIDDDILQPEFFISLESKLNGLINLDNKSDPTILHMSKNELNSNQIDFKTDLLFDLLLLVFNLQLKMSAASRDVSSILTKMAWFSAVAQGGKMVSEAQARLFGSIGNLAGTLVLSGAGYSRSLMAQKKVLNHSIPTKDGMNLRSEKIKILKKREANPSELKNNEGKIIGEKSLNGEQTEIKFADPRMDKLSNDKDVLRKEINTSSIKYDEIQSKVVVMQSQGQLLSATAMPLGNMSNSISEISAASHRQDQRLFEMSGQINNQLAQDQISGAVKEVESREKILQIMNQIAESQRSLMDSFSNRRS
ncbi:IpaC/SipC family type III secretion system effector [Herbaspirillum sp. RTI4]|uniref:IpaC/SipC family type III secretion system effector n=1 Tax=Herbaspirillum sp. RTI4 TaxID=3048640 RepID=UPI002AB4BA2E|nr:IpaC/SipC family type III secretion system effector [Herbaspirillum sp. RTI4]MDY7578377.1 IpaC/SipC family type III secretion system effector [Herbaspirillum sp. RTI4]